MDSLFSFDNFVNFSSISLDKLKVPSGIDSKEYLKKISKKIGLESKDIFDYFFAKNNVPICRYPQYYCSPIWNECYNNYKWRYMVINYKECNYLIVFRIVGVMFHEQYIALSYDILSDKYDVDGKQEVVDVLKRISCIKKAEIIVESDDYDALNFYNTCAPIPNNYKRNKINKLSMLGVKCLVYYNNIPNNVLQGVRYLYEKFSESRFKFNIKRQERYMKLQLEKGTPVFVFMYKDSVLGIKICSMDIGNSFFVHATKDISGLPIEIIKRDFLYNNDEMALLIKKFFGYFAEDKLQTYLFDNHHADAIFFDGLIENKKTGLFDYKQRHYKKTIKYKLIDICDYEYK